MGAGFPTDDPWADRLMNVGEQEFFQILSRIGRICIEPGSTCEYSNLGYAMLGRVIKNVSKGVSFQDFITESILKPLNMHHTVWKVDITSNWAAPCDNAPVLADGEFAALGGIFTNVEGLLLLLMKRK